MFSMKKLRVQIPSPSTIELAKKKKKKTNGLTKCSLSAMIQSCDF